MRKAFLFVISILTYTSNSYEINLEGEMPLSDCHVTSSETTFLCKDDKGSQFFIREYANEYIAFKKSKNGKYEQKEVFEIYETESEIVYMKPFSGEDVFSNNKEDYYRGDMKNFSDGMSKIYEKFFSSGKSISKDDKEIFDFVEDFKKTYKKQKKYYDSMMNGNLKVGLDNGENLLCKRAPGKRAAKCNLLDCGKDKLGNKILLLKDRTSEEGKFTSFAYDKNGKHAKSASRVKGIYSSFGVRLLEINSDFEKDNPFKERMLVPGEYHKNPGLFKSLMNPIDYYKIEDEFSQCSPLMKKLLDNQGVKAGELVRTSEMVQMIDLVNDSIESNYVNLETLPDYACVHNGVYYSPEGYQKLREVKVRPTKKTISMKKAQELFDKAKARKDIAWNYKLNGCYARAHLTARMFEEEDIHVDKAWLRGSLQVPGESKKFKWGYHVAPLVYVKDKNGKVQEMIIDPSISDKPITPDKWAMKMGVFFDDSEIVPFPSPLNTQNFLKTSYSVTNSDPYFPELDTSLTEEMKMQKAKDTMSQHLNGIDPFVDAWRGMSAW